jgi:pimeloyl-ACP methyl ester carboxylesterase
VRDDLVASGFTAVSFDAPGHGGTPSATSSLPEFRAAIAAIAERLGPLHALVGHSLGASAAALYAETISTHQPAPGLVLIAPLPGFEFAMDHFTRLFPLDAVARERLICSIEQRVATDRGAMELQTLVPRAPSLLVHDAGDRSIPLRYSRALAASWPRARLLETNGLGHNRILQDATVTRAIVDFVQQLPQTRGSALDRQLRALDEAWPD